MVRCMLKFRDVFLLIVVICSIVTLWQIITSQEQTKTIVEINELDLLLEQLLDSSTSLIDVQIYWNKFISMWTNVLLKFLSDGCTYCHSNDLKNCMKSIHIDNYVHYVNRSFYPSNENKRPKGVGFYHSFDLKSIRSLNHSVLSTDVSICDYFHMFQLIMNVQIALHEKQINYFITKGTLIGTLRHHDVIPWDTDIDIFIPFSAVFKLKNSFKQINLWFKQTDSIFLSNLTQQTEYTNLIRRKDLYLYEFRNVYRVTSYKIFSINSSRVNGTHYRWPKIDIFPYRETRTTMFAYPHHRHNYGTMHPLNKSLVYPTRLRPLGPLLVPTPHSLQKSLDAMVRLGKSNLFQVCQGNTFLHRQNRVSSESWRVPCQLLIQSYPFVKSERNSDTQICSEVLLLNMNNNQTKSLSSYKYKCGEFLPRTL